MHASLKATTFVVLAMGLSMLNGCGGTQPASPWADTIANNILLIGNGDDPEGLDPHLVTGVPEHHILTALFEGLTRADPDDMTPVPGVAESWDLSDDGLVYTFHLRDNARWSNGDPVTAGDFLYAWRRILTPSLAGQYAYMLYSMKNAQAYNEGAITDFARVGCRALDDYTLEVTLENPTPYFLNLHIHYTWFPLHRATIEAHGALDDRNSKWTRPENIVSNGPFVLEAWKPKDVIQVRRSETYWNAKNVRLDGVNFYPVKDEQVEERMFRAGQLHITGNVSLTKLAAYKKNHPELLRIDPYLTTYFYRINTARPPLSDVRVRRALAMAIDRNMIVENVTRGGERPAGALTPPDTAHYTSPVSVHFDPGEARRLLAEAGYPKGEGFPPFEILYNTLDKHQIIAEAIQQMWKENLNIEVSLINQDWKVYLDSQDNRDYDVARAGWVGDVADPVNFLECFTTGNGNNHTGYANAEYDRLLERARATRDLDERNALYGQAETMLVNDLPIIPIYFYTRPFLIAPEVKNFGANNQSYFAFDQVYFGRPDTE